MRAATADAAEPLFTSRPPNCRHAGFLPLAAGSVRACAHNNTVLYMDPRSGMAAAKRSGHSGSRCGSRRRAGAALTGMNDAAVSYRKCTNENPELLYCAQKTC